MYNFDELTKAGQEKHRNMIDAANEQRQAHHSTTEPTLVKRLLIALVIFLNTLIGR